MLKKIAKSLIAVVEQFAIAFFFATLFIILIQITCKDKIETVISLSNVITINEQESQEIELEFDFTSRTLKDYPAYGTKWGTISLPSLGLSDIPVYHGDSLSIIKYAAGHYTGSYFPGEGGSIVICAHNSRQHFYKLPQSKVGDKIVIETDYGTFTYQVYKTKIIQDTDSGSLPIQKDEEILMLYTCYPVGTIGHKDKRFVVYAKLVDLEYVGDSDEA